MKKNTILLFILLLMLFLGITGCNNDKNNQNDKEPPQVNYTIVDEIGSYIIQNTPDVITPGFQLITTHPQYKFDITYTSNNLLISSEGIFFSTSPQESILTFEIIHNKVRKKFTKKVIIDKISPHILLSQIQNINNPNKGPNACVNLDLNVLANTPEKTYLFGGKLNIYSEYDLLNKFLIFINGEISLRTTLANINGNMLFYLYENKTYLGVDASLNVLRGEPIIYEVKEVMNASKILETLINEELDIRFIEILEIFTSFDKFPREIINYLANIKYDELTTDEKNLIDAILGLFTISYQNSNCLLGIKITKENFQNILIQINNLSNIFNNIDALLVFLNDNSYLEFTINVIENNISIIKLDTNIKVELPKENMEYEIKLTLTVNTNGVNKPILPTEEELLKYQEVEQFSIFNDFFRSI
ncbi:MAG TPA: hypothetical protein PLY84_01410 [Bacilli bacterium]|nr:hypothetical protein [Bacilli bacterium]